MQRVSSAISEDIREEQAAFQVRSCVSQLFALEINHRAMPRVAKMMQAVHFNDFQQASIASTMTVPRRLQITGNFYRINAVGNQQLWGQIGRFSKYNVCLHSIRRADRLAMDLCQHSQTLLTGFSTSDRTSVHTPPSWVCSNVPVSLHMQKSIWRAVDKATTPLYLCERKLDGRVWDEPFSSPIVSRLQGQCVSGSR